MHRLSLEPVSPKAAVIMDYHVRGLPWGEGRVAMNSSGHGWGYFWVSNNYRGPISLIGTYQTAQEALQALQRIVDSQVG